ncbi:hypothetical protein EZS27_013976 [termite gut metagenome]|uniref:Uncharacterized protein n=1 Tax=termite gut metagenome TaxID=433724 RepID=A0A5J4RWI4_9ZZZZ
MKIGLNEHDLQIVSQNILTRLYNEGLEIGNEGLGQKEILNDQTPPANGGLANKDGSWKGKYQNNAEKEKNGL